MEFWAATFHGNTCGHRHKSRDAAMKCADKTVERARAALAGAGETFAYPATPDQVIATPRVTRVKPINQFGY